MPQNILSLKYIYILERHLMILAKIEKNSWILFKLSNEIMILTEIPWYIKDFASIFFSGLEIGLKWKTFFND